ncbi:MAG: polysaccharide biosynthesis/export family protein [Shinella sp.]|nr:polysaccharide biosynthesis/export family protein [Shinella sp.]
MRKAGIVLACLGLAGCQGVPANGPLASDITADAGRSASELQRQNAEVFDIVDVDARSARLITNYMGSTLQRRFKIGGGVREPVVGVGDHLKVTIFEASADGLFSTTESKQTPMDIVVQTNGSASIPYVGTIRLAGKTLEQVREAILDSLRNKAVEPDVLVNLASTSSRNVTVGGAVGNSAVLPLGLVNESLLDVIARAGGPTAQPYEVYVNLTRGRRTGSVLLKTIVENPGENIFVQPGDQVFLVNDPRTFTILGSVRENQRIPFGANDLNLLEAVALAGGGNDNASDMKGFFIFRYEEPEIFTDLVGRTRFDELVRKGLRPDKQGRYPLVYRFNMANADSMIVGQTFPIKNRDVIYASRHPTVDFVKFLTIIGRPIGVAGSAVSVVDNFER